jgi:hypothetical protein
VREGVFFSHIGEGKIAGKVDTWVKKDLSSENRARRIFCIILKISQCFVVCDVAVKFVRRLHYGLEISKLVFTVVVGKHFTTAFY